MGASTMRVYFCRYVTSKISIWAWIKICESPRSANFALPGNRPCNLWSTRYPWNIWNTLQWLKVAMDPCPFISGWFTYNKLVIFQFAMVCFTSELLTSGPTIGSLILGGATGTPWLLPIQGPPYCRKRQQKMAARWARWGQEAPPDGWKNQYHKFKIQRMVNVGCTSQGVYFHVQFWRQGNWGRIP